MDRKVFASWNCFGYTLVEWPSFVVFVDLTNETLVDELDGIVVAALLQKIAYCLNENVTNYLVLVVDCSNQLVTVNLKKIFLKQLYEP